MNTNDALRRLEKAKAKIDRAVQQKAELQGSRRTLLARLKDEFRIESLAAGEKRVDELEAQRDEWKDKLATALDRLDELQTDLP